MGVADDLLVGIEYAVTKLALRFGGVGVPGRGAVERQRPIHRLSSKALLRLARFTARPSAVRNLHESSRSVRYARLSSPKRRVISRLRRAEDRTSPSTP